VNFLDWTALAIPAGWREDGLPFGITLIGDVWEERRLLDLGRRWLSDAPRLLGATRVEYEEESSRLLVAVDEIPIAVVGAHHSGFPLNKDLVSRGATLDTATATAPCYKLYALQTTGPVKKPGLQRVAEGGESIDVEIWNMPHAQMGSFLGTVAPPLGIGSIELQNGRWVHGFICEPIGLDNADDITHFRGWRSYIQSLASPTRSLSGSHCTPVSSSG
jgi:urea carboxylase/allophanate hydrolase